MSGWLFGWLGNIRHFFEFIFEYGLIPAMVGQTEKVE